MTRHVCLDDKLDASVGAILSNVRQCLGIIRQKLLVGALGCKFGQRRDLNGPGLCIRAVEVENVHLVPRETVDGAQDVVVVVVASSDVHVEATVSEFRRVMDPNRCVRCVHASVGGCLVEWLRKCFKSANEADACYGCYHDRAIYKGRHLNAADIDCVRFVNLASQGFEDVHRVRSVLLEKNVFDIYL